MTLRLTLLALSITLAAARATTPITLELDAPSPGYSITIESVHRVNGELWVLAQAKHADGIAAQVITRISAKVTVNAPKAKTRFFIHGDVWNWIDKSEFSIVKDDDEFRKKIAEATRIEFTPSRK